MSGGLRLPNVFFFSYIFSSYNNFNLAVGEGYTNSWYFNKTSIKWTLDINLDILMTTIYKTQSWHTHEHYIQDPILTYSWPLYTRPNLDIFMTTIYKTQSWHTHDHYIQDPILTYSWPLYTRPNLDILMTTICKTQSWHTHDHYMQGPILAYSWPLYAWPNLDILSWPLYTRPNLDILMTTIYKTQSWHTHDHYFLRPEIQYVCIWKARKYLKRMLSCRPTYGAYTNTLKKGKEIHFQMF